MSRKEGKNDGDAGDSEGVSDGTVANESGNGRKWRKAGGKSDTNSIGRPTNEGVDDGMDDSNNSIATNSRDSSTGKGNRGDSGRNTAGKTSTAVAPRASTAPSNRRRCAKADRAAKIDDNDNNRSGDTVGDGESTDSSIRVSSSGTNSKNTKASACKNNRDASNATVANCPSSRAEGRYDCYLAFSASAFMSATGVVSTLWISNYRRENDDANRLHAVERGASSERPG